MTTGQPPAQPQPVDAPTSVIDEEQWAAAQALVATWPPLDEEVIDQLATHFAGVRAARVERNQARSAA